MLYTHLDSSLDSMSKRLAVHLQADFQDPELVGLTAELRALQPLEASWVVLKTSARLSNDAQRAMLRAFIATKQHGINKQG